jgi:4-amino-4-deoxy-L-arabinose transferase-like glycosyltransferase
MPRALPGKDATMSPAQPSPRPSVWRWRFLAAALILGAAGFRLAHLALHCPLDLAPDEAHYWDWSRHLDLSYYSKGPLVAWLIRLGCLLAGGLSRALIGNEMLAVRLPAVACGSLLLVALYALTARVYRRESLALGVVALALTAPLIAAGSTLMTIDAPYTCCWAWALVLGHQAVFRRSAWAWPVAGLLVGLGILAKYTMVLWVPSLGLFLLTSADGRRLLRRPGPWVLAATGALCCLPILVWNLRHGWVSLWHVSGQAGILQEEAAAGVRWLGPLNFVALQAAVLLGFWFVLWLRAMFDHAPWREPRPEVRYLWWMSAPMFLVFLLFGFKTGGGEPNWPVTAYLSGMVLTAGWLGDQLRSPAGWARRLTMWSAGLGCALGLGVLGLLYGYVWVVPLVARLAGPPTPGHGMPLRRIDPVCRLRGWRELAAEVDRVCELLRRQGVEPVLAGNVWNVPGELGFYCQGHPAVYSLGPVLGDRHSQYDLWRPNPVADPALFVGRTFVYVGHITDAMPQAFERIEPSQEVTCMQGEQVVSRWYVTVCRGYRGFPQDPNGARPHY